MQRLMTKRLEAALPPLYSQDGSHDPMVYGHWFSCINNWDLYATEYDPVERVCFGFVIGFVPEMGYFTISELEEVNRKYGLQVFERDASFEPCRAHEVYKIASEFPWLFE